MKKFRKRFEKSQPFILHVTTSETGINMF